MAIGAFFVFLYLDIRDWYKAAPVKRYAPLPATQWYLAHSLAALNEIINIWMYISCIIRC